MGILINPHRSYTSWYDWKHGLLDFPTKGSQRYYRAWLLHLAAWRPSNNGFPWLMGTQPICRVSDLFNETTPTWFIEDIIRMFYRRSNIVWAIVTQYPQRAADLLSRYPGPRHIWIGIQAQTQRELEERESSLARLTEWPIHFLLAEPLLEGLRIATPFQWIVCGGGTGPSVLTFQHQWGVELLRQAQQCGARFYWTGAQLRHPEVQPTLLKRCWHEYPAVS